jgi:hypothetical protein
MIHPTIVKYPFDYLTWLKTKDALIVPAARIHVAENIRQRAEENISRTLLRAIQDQ